MWLVACQGGTSREAKDRGEGIVLIGGSKSDKKKQGSRKGEGKASKQDGREGKGKAWSNECWKCNNCENDRDLYSRSKTAYN